MKHTKGPWEVFLTPSGHQYIESVPNGKRIDGHEFIAEAEMLEEGCSRSAQANARLLAAAPELLEALKSLFSSAPASGFTRESDNIAYGRALALAKAAILKAEGNHEAK